MLKNSDPSSGLSRVDSSLESLAAIPALDCEQCNFRDLKLQLLSPAKLYNFRGSRSAAELPDDFTAYVLLVISSRHVELQL